MFHRIEKLERKETIDQECYETYPFVRNEILEFRGYPRGYCREKINQLSKQELISLLVPAEDVAEESNNDKTERYESNNKEIGNGACQIKTFIPEKITYAVAYCL
jgi:hypothetical protein